MEDRTVALLEEIRDLMQRTVNNQEQLLRAHDESMRLYRSVARRQTIASIVGLVLLLVIYAVFVSR